jgi:hypothetical protein
MDIVIEKHDLDDVLEVKKIRELIGGCPRTAEFFETMIKIINKKINGPIIERSEIYSSESEDELPLSDV